MFLCVYHPPCHVTHSPCKKEMSALISHNLSRKASKDLFILQYMYIYVWSLLYIFCIQLIQERLDKLLETLNIQYILYDVTSAAQWRIVITEQLFLNEVHYLVIMWSVCRRQVVVCVPTFLWHFCCHAVVVGPRAMQNVSACRLANDWSQLNEIKP